jgi:ABC-2 type transport system ATP-binding protein
LSNPEGLFSSVASVTGWSVDDTGGYVLTVGDVRVAAPAITRALVAAEADVLSLAEGHHSLEEVYLELVGASGSRGEK